MMDMFNLIVSPQRCEPGSFIVVLLFGMWLLFSRQGPCRVFCVDLMDEIPGPLFHTLSQVDRLKMTPAERQ